MTIWVSWSIAFDYIMVYNDYFKNHILPEKINMLNVSFNISQVQKNYWWTWYNISYNLWLLWENPILIWAIWYDYEFIDCLKINYQYVYKSNKYLTAFCNIVTDLDNNQITSFYIWAMQEATNTWIDYVSQKIKYLIISPDNPAAMVENLKKAKQKWIKVFFDPWQALNVLTKEDLVLAFEIADYLTVNEYEFEMFQNKTWFDKSKIINKFEKTIITHWKNWVELIDKQNTLNIEAIKTDDLIDPTWAWDAFRAWVLKWLNSWFDWELSAKIWTLCAHYCIKSYWTANHFFDYEEFKLKFKDIYWIELK